MRTLRMALDWTANVNHLGFFVARELGMYKKRGFALEIIDPRSDNYAVTRVSVWSSEKLILRLRHLKPSLA